MQPHMYLKNKYTRMHGRMHSAFACLQKCVHRKHTKGVTFSIVALLCKSLVIRKKPAKGPVGLFFVGGGLFIFMGMFKVYYSLSICIAEIQHVMLTFNYDWQTDLS